MGSSEYYIHVLYDFDDAVEESRKMAHFSLLEETTKRDGHFLLSTNAFCQYYWNHFLVSFFKGWVTIAAMWKKTVTVYIYLYTWK